MISGLGFRDVGFPGLEGEGGGGLGFRVWGGGGGDDNIWLKDCSSVGFRGKRWWQALKV